MRPSRSPPGLFICRGGVVDVFTCRVDLPCCASTPWSYLKFSAAFPNTKSPWYPSFSLTVPEPDVAVSRIARIIPFLPSLQSKGIEIVCDCCRGSYDPEQVNFPSVTKKLPSNGEAVLTPVSTRPSCPMTATGTVIVVAQPLKNIPNNKMAWCAFFIVILFV